MVVILMVKLKSTEKIEKLEAKLKAQKEQLRQEYEKEIIKASTAIINFYTENQDKKITLLSRLSDDEKKLLTNLLD